MEVPNPVAHQFIPNKLLRENWSAGVPLVFTVPKSMLSVFLLKQTLVNACSKLVPKNIKFDKRRHFWVGCHVEKNLETKLSPIQNVAKWFAGLGTSQSLNVSFNFPQYEFLVNFFYRFFLLIIGGRGSMMIGVWHCDCNKIGHKTGSAKPTYIKKNEKVDPRLDAVLGNLENKIIRNIFGCGFWKLET